MEIKVDLSAEQINNQICEAIAKSAIGKELQTTIERAVKDMSASYKNPFEPIVKRFISDAAQKIINDEYSEQITKMVKDRITEQFTEDLFTKLWQSFENKY